MATGTTVVEIVHPNQEVDLTTLGTANLNMGRVASAIDKVINGVVNGSARPGTTVRVTSGAAQAYGTVTFSGVGGTAATGSYALSGVGGTAASNTVTLGGGAGDVEIFVDGTSAGEIPFNTSDSQTAADFVTEWNGNPIAFAKATASNVGAVITMTWNAKGTVGNSKTISATRSAGTATVGGNGTTLGGGAQGAVTVTINGTAVGPTDTTNLTDTAAATAVAAAVTADATLGPLVTAAGSTTNVNLTWKVKGTDGNAVTLAAGVSATGTATRSGATLSGGADGSVTITALGTAEVTDTTNLTDTEAAALSASEINANTSLSPYVTATSSAAVLTITANTWGVAGNQYTLTAATDTGTATTGHLSGGKLSGGTAGTSSYLERP